MNSRPSAVPWFHSPAGSVQCSQGSTGTAPDSRQRCVEPGEGKRAGSTVPAWIPATGSGSSSTKISLRRWASTANPVEREIRGTPTSRQQPWLHCGFHRRCPATTQVRSHLMKSQPIPLSPGSPGSQPGPCRLSYRSSICPSELWEPRRSLRTPPPAGHPWVPA